MRFVISADRNYRQLGIGKQVSPDLTPGDVEYFTSPAEEPLVFTIDPESIREIELESQERIFFRSEETWRVAQLQADVGQGQLALRANNENFLVDVEDAFIRSNYTIESPGGLLQARTTETPFWHTGRQELLRSLLEQRRAYRGLTGLASANIELHQHQVGIAKRILFDPVPRYLLADEVGLGKTIEVGIVLRQMLLDNPDEEGILILAPDHLVEQWQDELKRLFYLEPERASVVPHTSPQVAAALEAEQAISILVIDEAHLIAQHAFSGGPKGDHYRAVSELAKASRGVLLLSATPVLHNEGAFLAMLHLLDPDTHRLENKQEFHELVVKRELIAEVLSALNPGAPAFVLKPALEQLEPFAKSDAHLRELVNLLNGAGDGERDALIDRVKGYLDERFHLDHRVLRTRRSQSSIEPDLPKRSHQFWEIADPTRQEIWEWLDSWRFRASEGERTNEAKESFVAFLSAALSHPKEFTAAVEGRQRVLAEGQPELFNEEVSFLQTAPQAVSVEQDPRVNALCKLLQETEEDAQKWVVFISSSVICSEVGRYLKSTQSFETVCLSSPALTAKSVSQFRDRPEVRAILCDQSNEDGLNLQGVGAKVFHFDLPLVASRIEQRIGRLDRLGGKDRTVESYVPMPSGEISTSDYEAKWIHCLCEGLGVFGRSVASLQHVIDAGREDLKANLLDHGVSAIDMLQQDWLATDGQLSISREERRLANQNLLDQLQFWEAESADFYESLEEYEYPEEGDAREARFDAAIAGWTQQSLGFRGHRVNHAPTRVKYEYSRETLLSKRRFLLLFPRSFDLDTQYRGPTTGWVESDRKRAREGGIPLLRMGHPFVEDLERSLPSDERGRAYVFWRTVPGYEQRFATGSHTDAYFAFDWIIQVDHRRVQDVIRDLGLSAGAVRRRAEDVFPPLFTTVWLDVDGNSVNDEGLLAQLTPPFNRDQGDRAVYPNDWGHVDDLGLYGDWAELCRRLEEAARAAVAGVTDLDHRKAGAQETLERQLTRNQEHLAVRAQAAAGAVGDVNALARENALHRCLCDLVKEPRLTLDSIGAVFLSSQFLP